MTLGHLIRTTRTKRDLSQDDVAAITGSSKSTLSRVERGILEPRLFLFLQLSVLLRLRVGRILEALKET